VVYAAQSRQPHPFARRGLLVHLYSKVIASCERWLVTHHEDGAVGVTHYGV
jgi:hypothetical protein